MTTAADLAARLRAMPSDRLVELVVRRRLPGAALAVNGPAAITDFFDLADALRTPESVDRALDRLPRRALVALSDPASAAPDDLEPAIALALADEHEADDAVAARLTARTDLQRALDAGPAPSLQAETGTVSEPAAGSETGTDPGTAAGPGSGTDDASGGPGGTADVPDAVTDPDAVDRAGGIAAERAFTTMTALAELLRQVDAGAVHELAKGGIGAPLARALSAAAGTEQAEVAPLLRILAMVDAVDTGEQVWTATDSGRAWLLTDWPERWADLVARWRDALPEPVRAVLALAADDWDHVAELGRWAYPGGADWLDADLATAADTAEQLGLVVDGRTTATGRTLLAIPADGVVPDRAAAVSAARADLPPTVDAVYLQHDLTVIAPGPLAPTDDDRLRAVADVEAPGLATRYRISEDSIRRALLGGRGREEILAILGDLSATGLPQPVSYLVDQVAARAGSIVVDRDTGGIGTVVRGPADQLDLIGVDAELRHFTWDRRTVTVLVTRYPLDVVAAELERQRYPAVVAAGARETRSPESSTRRAAPKTPESQAKDLVDRLRVATERGDREPEQEWLGRQIDLAIRGKVPIRVIVRMPDGTEAPFTIVPTSVAAGRVRGRDTHADVERTLPLSLVVTVESEA